MQNGTNIPIIRTLTKSDLCRLLGIITPSCKYNYRIYKKQLSDQIIINMGFDLNYFKNAKTFGNEDCAKIQAHFKFSDDEIKELEF